MTLFAVANAALFPLLHLGLPVHAYYMFPYPNTTGLASVPQPPGIIFMLLYFNTKSFVKVAIVYLAVPFSLVGAVWFLWWLGFNMSVAVWVGLIALAGLDAETGVVMLLYLGEMPRPLAKTTGALKLNTRNEAIDHGAVKRVRPKIMTASPPSPGLLPIMWGHHAGSDVMKRIAAPMIGVFTSVVMELTVYPAIYYLWKKQSIAEKTLS